MKRFFPLALVLLVLPLAACGAGGAGEAPPPLPLEVPGSLREEGETPPETPEPFQEDGETYLPLAEGLPGERITARETEEGLRLTEEGLTLDLRAGEALLYRRGYVTGAMSAPPLVREGGWYLPQSFCQPLAEGGSLFDRTLFFQDEIGAALENPQEPFSQQLLASIERPRSMGIEVPNLDPERVFVETPLSEYPAILTQELAAMGVQGASDRAYGEYIVLTQSRTVGEAQLTQFFLRELPGEDPARWTVSAYKQWQAERLLEDRMAALTEEERRFLEEKNISPEDWFWLWKTYPGSWTEQSDETLRGVLEDYYRAALAMATGT